MIKPHKNPNRVEQVDGDKVKPEFLRQFIFIVCFEDISTHFDQEKSLPKVDQPPNRKSIPGRGEKSEILPGYSSHCFIVDFTGI
jgi:hypothetical protein